MKFKYALIIILITTSCTLTPTSFDNFTYIFSMENTNNYKIEFQLNSDLTYKTIQYNYFFDNFEQRKRPIISEGILGEGEFSKFIELLQKTDIKNKKKIYGFKEETASYSDILYTIQLTQDGNSQYVFINTSETILIPKEFTDLIEYTNKIINTKHYQQIYK